MFGHLNPIDEIAVAFCRRRERQCSRLGIAGNGSRPRAVRQLPGYRFEGRKDGSLHVRIRAIRRGARRRARLGYIKKKYRAKVIRTPSSFNLRSPWTYGALVNHIWSFAGNEDRADVNSTFLQPFISYTTPDAWTFAVNTESTYDWESDEWSVPVNFQVSKLVKFGEQPVSITAGARYWAAAPDNGPQGWGARLAVTFLFPK